MISNYKLVAGNNMVMSSELNVKLDKIDKMAGLTFQNVCRLHFDSILLFNNESYASSYFLSVLALEELGKYYQLDHFLFHSRTDGRMGEFLDRNWLDDIFYHHSKQYWFTDLNRHKLSKKFQEKVFNGKLELEKQNSIYVGLPRTKKRIDFKGKINNPLSISKNKVIRQITTLNDSLIEQCLIVNKEVGCLDSYYAENFISDELIEKIESAWHSRAKTNKRYINNLKKIKVN